MAKILVVDDSNDLLELFSKVLSIKGHKVETANSKNKLLNQISAFVPDLILLDVKLNGEDGRELCKEIKQNNLPKSIPVILISADPVALEYYKECNADDVIEKPFEIKTLIDKVSAHLRKQFI